MNSITSASTSVEIFSLVSSGERSRFFCSLDCSASGESFLDAMVSDVRFGAFSEDNWG